MLYYFSEKWLFAKRYSIQVWISEELNNCLLNYIDFIPIIIPVSSLLFDYLLYRPSSISILFLYLNISLVILAIINLIISEDVNYKFLTEHEFEKRLIPYSEARKEFLNDYDRMNPITMT
jgi:hypothetical protein